jgi:hypothetical protein
MKTVLSALVAVGLTLAAVAPASAFDAKSFFDQIAREAK